MLKPYRITRRELDILILWSMITCVVIISKIPYILAIITAIAACVLVLKWLGVL